MVVFKRSFPRLSPKSITIPKKICSNLYPSRKFIDDPAINFQTHRGHVDYVTIGVFFFADFFSNFHSSRMFNQSLLDGETIRLFQWTVWHDPRARILEVSLEFAVLLLRYLLFKLCNSYGGSLSPLIPKTFCHKYLLA